MRARRLLPWVLAALFSCVPLRAEGPALSLEQYENELRQLQLALEGAVGSGATTEKVMQELPSGWTVEANAKTFYVSTAAIRDDLSEFKKDNKKTERLEHARGTVALLLADAEGVKAPALDSQAERQRLDQILARKEFHDAAGESWWERLKREVQMLVFRLLRNVIGSSAFPVVSRIVVWAVAILAVCLLAWWLVRSYLRSEEFASFSGEPEAVSAKPWRDWQAEARLAAEQGRWRDAIHLSYWSAISFLEGQGLWRPDRARTPREYLRLLPREDAHREPLHELTREFERAWYGSASANEGQFLTATAILERLGCR